MEPKARICWRFGKVQGKGEPIPWRTAQDAAKRLNAEHGPGTHWIEVLSSALPETVADQQPADFES